MRRRKRRSLPDVELNLAAMLDMAFQLLTFFILTFRPAPIEGQFSLRLPPPEPIANADAPAKPGAAGSGTKQLRPLIVRVRATEAGRIASLAIGEKHMPSLRQLASQMKTVLSYAESPYDRVVVQFDPQLKYEELMRVIDMCVRQKMSDGKKLSKLSFAPIPTNE